MKRQEYINSLFETYSLVSVLSEKNNCKVLRLRHKTLGRDLVLHSFPAPVSAYEQLSHIECQNLPVIYDTTEFEDGQVVLEEFIDAITVSQVMESGTYRYSGAKKVLKGVCNALCVLHSLSIVHRDVKPENIMIDKSGRVVLIDFNVSRKVSEATHDTVVMGTVGYASPEQLGVSQTDARTDIYAAGVLLNVMLTGSHPSKQMARGRAGSIVRKCTAVSPDDRFSSAEKLFNAL